jgi:hypothetical protein
MAGSTAYRLTEPALADSLSRPCYRGVTNLRRVYRLDLDLPDLDQPDLPGRTYRAPAGLEHHLAHVARGRVRHLRPRAWGAPGRLAAPGGRAGGRIRVRE